MYYTYVLQSEVANEFYYGSTSDMKSRLDSHNAGQVPHTKKYKPWKVAWYAAFSSKQKALDFEQYLKAGSGKTFLRKRLL